MSVGIGGAAQVDSSVSVVLLMRRSSCEHAFVHCMGDKFSRFSVVERLVIRSSFFSKNVVVNVSS